MACRRGLFMWPQWISLVSPVLLLSPSPIMEFYASFPPFAVLGSYLTCQFWFITKKGTQLDRKMKCNFWLSRI